MLPVYFLTDSSSKPSLISSLDCLSSIVQRISTDPAPAPPGDSVVPRGPESPQSSPASSSSSAEPNSIYEPQWTTTSWGLIICRKPRQCIQDFFSAIWDFLQFYRQTEDCCLNPLISEGKRDIFLTYSCIRNYGPFYKSVYKRCLYTQGHTLPSTHVAHTLIQPQRLQRLLCFYILFMSEWHFNKINIYIL